MFHSLKRIMLLAGVSISSVLAAQEKVDVKVIDSIVEVKLKQQKEADAKLNKEQTDLLDKLKTFANQRIVLSGGLAVRVGEMDWDYEKSEGVYADDRFRTRFGFNLQAQAKISNNFSVTGRMRSGTLQFTWTDFGSEAEDKLHLILDRAFFKYQSKQYWVTLGRNQQIWESLGSLQFDVPAHDGIAMGAQYKLGKTTTFEPKLAYYIERHGSSSVKNDGKMYGVMLKSMTDLESTKIAGRAGLIVSNELQDASKGIHAGHYVNGSTGKYYSGDLANDYNILLLGTSITFKKLKNLTIEGDFYQNLRKYDTNPLSWQITTGTEGTPDFTDDRTGYTISAWLGNTSGDKGAWKAGAYYIYLEKYAAQDFFSSYNHATWTSTNMKGFEFFGAYQILKNLEVYGRLFFMEDIKGYNGNDMDFTQHGNRFRLDLKFTF